MIGAISQPPNEHSFFIINEEFSFLYMRTITVFSEAIENRELPEEVLEELDLPSSSFTEKDVIAIEEEEIKALDLSKGETQEGGDKERKGAFVFFSSLNRVKNFLKMAGFFSQGGSCTFSSSKHEVSSQPRENAALYETKGVKKNKTTIQQEKESSQGKSLSERVARFRPSFSQEKGVLIEKLSYVLRLVEEVLHIGKMEKSGQQEQTNNSLQKPSSHKEKSLAEESFTQEEKKSFGFVGKNEAGKTGLGQEMMSGARKREILQTFEKVFRSLKIFSDGFSSIKEPRQVLQEMKTLFQQMPKLFTLSRQLLEYTDKEKSFCEQEKIFIKQVEVCLKQIEKLLENEGKNGQERLQAGVVNEKLEPLLQHITKLCFFLCPEIASKNPFQPSFLKGHSFRTKTQEEFIPFSQRAFRANILEKTQGIKQPLDKEGLPVLKMEKEVLNEKTLLKVYPQYVYKKDRPIPFLDQDTIKKSLKQDSEIKPTLIPENSESKKSESPSYLIRRELLREKIFQQIEALAKAPPFARVIPLIFAVPSMIIRSSFSKKKTVSAVSPTSKDKKEAVDNEQEGEGVMLLAYVPDGETQEQGFFLPRFLKKFAIGVYPVTNAQFAEYLNRELINNRIVLDEKKQVFSLKKEILCRLEGGLEGKQTGDRFLIEPKQGKADLPVAFVSYFGAEAFCEEAGFRLPTQLEWEKAASICVNTKQKMVHQFIFGCSQDDMDPSLATYERKEALPVGFYNGKNKVEYQGRLISTADAVSPFGCYDMSGNIGEWVDVGQEKEALIKGGSFASSLEGVKVFSGIFKPKETLDACTGFRVSL